MRYGPSECQAELLAQGRNPEVLGIGQENG